MPSKVCLFSLLVSISLCMNVVLAQAQPSTKPVKGVIMSLDPPAPLHLVSVAIYQHKDTTLVSGTMTNAEGVFVLERIKTGNYLLRISFIGYKTEVLEWSVGAEGSKPPDTIYLHRTAQYLEAVSINGTATDKMITSEMVSIHVARSEGAVTGNLVEILRKTQGVTIDPDNTIYLYGNRNILVLVNGRPTTLDAIQSMPVSQVERIEVITNPNVRYDAEGTGGIINIVTKAEAERGLTGNISLNYGLLNRINGGINIQYTGKKWSTGANISLRDETTDIRSQLTRQLVFNNMNITQEMEAQQRNLIPSVSVMIQGKPLPGHVFVANYRFTLPQQYNEQRINGSITNDMLPVLYHRRNDISFSRANQEFSATYKRVFKENRHVLSMDAMHSRIKGSRPADYYIEELYLQRSEGGGAPQMATVQIDYLKSYSPSGRIEAGIKQTARWNRFDYRFYERDSVNGPWTLHPLFSNDLEHHEEILAGYLMLSDTLFSAVALKAGMRLEFSNSKLIQETSGDTLNDQYWHPFPYLMLQYRQNKKSLWVFSLARRVTRPTYPQLNPWINVIDQLTYESGNKHLQPEISDRFELKYNATRLNTRFTGTLWHNLIRDHITQVTTITHQETLLVTFVNAKKFSKTGLDGDFVYDLNGRITLNTTLSVFRSEATGVFPDTSRIYHQTSWTGVARLLFRPDALTTIQLSGNYQSPQALPQFQLNSIWFADFSIRRSIPQQRLTITLSVSDLLNTRDWYITTENSLFLLSNSSKNTSRVLWVGLSWSLKNHKPLQPAVQREVEGERTMIRTGQ